MGRIDLHNHILFDLDDGCQSLDESLRLARALVAAGYSEAATTPHARPNMNPSEALCTQRRAELQAALDAERIPLRLHPGREHHLTPELLEQIERQEARTLGEGPWLLIELPFATAVPRLQEILFRVQIAGYKPLIAHPERCAHFTASLREAERLYDAGIAFQIEVASLSGLYGRPARKYAQALLDRGLVAVAATDAHRPDSAQIILGKGLDTLARGVGAATLQRLTVDNPRRILAGEPLSAF